MKSREVLSEPDRSSRRAQANSVNGTTSAAFGLAIASVLVIGSVRMPSDPARPAPAGIHFGDRVAYSKQFLQSTGQHTGDAPLARGEVQGLTKLGTILLAHIRWDRDGLPDKVNVHNLSRVVDGVVMERD